MVYKHIKFPTRIRYTKENPVVDFYKKCMRSAFNSSDVSGVQVWSFEVNSIDYKKLENLLKKHIKKTFPELPYRKLKLEKSMILLDIGPRICNDVASGFVRINLMELYGNSKN